MRGRFASMCFLERISSKSIVSPGLHCRSRNLLRYFPRKGLAQPVLQCFLKNDGVTRDFHHVTVEHRVVFAQKISFIQTVTDDGDETAFGMHHAAQVDRPDFQTLLAAAATRATRVAYNRTDERIPSPVRIVLVVGDGLLLARGLLAFSASHGIAGYLSGRWRIAFGSRDCWLPWRAVPGGDDRNPFRRAHVFRTRRTGSRL